MKFNAQLKRGPLYPYHLFSSLPSRSLVLLISWLSFRCSPLSSHLFLSSYQSLLSISLSLCRSVALSLCLSVSLSLCLSVSLFLSLSLSLSPSLSLIYIYMCVYIYISLCDFSRMCPSLSISIYLSIGLPLWVSACCCFLLLFRLCSLFVVSDPTLQSLL